MILMLKKLLSAFLVMLTLLGVCSVFATADNPGPGGDADYIVMEDDDFTSLTEYTEGNEKATILYPGDTIFFQKELKTSVTYFPDVDANAAGLWEAANEEMTAFSISAKRFLTDEVSKSKFAANENKYTVLGLDQKVNEGTTNEAEFDFTINYPESNTFIGWVVFRAKTVDQGNVNSLVLYGLWDKTFHEDSNGEEDDDLTVILDTNATWLQKLTAPFLAYNKQIVNAILNGLQKVLDKMTGTETESNGDVGVYQASVQSIKIMFEIFARWLDSWVTPIISLFD
jgi:hypothetical protein